MHGTMATHYWYTIFVIIVAVAILFIVNYSATHFSEFLRKLIIILSLFTIIGTVTYPGDPK
jgi:glucan phosphoethanolaminetransferase (alkaline phosphatase superfamily)